MGWLRDDKPGHEGYVVGLVRSDAGWRELGGTEDGPDRPLTYVQVGCDCGWRSSRLRAPFGTTWMPSIVCLPREAHEDRAYAIWDEHMRSAAHTHLNGC